jgi:hypothetical protein
MSPKRDKKSNVWAESLDWQLIVFGVMVGWMETLRPATYPKKTKSKDPQVKSFKATFIHWAVKPQFVSS